jgi:hypothetical protein
MKPPQKMPPGFASGAAGKLRMASGNNCQELDEGDHAMQARYCHLCGTRLQQEQPHECPYASGANLTSGWHHGIHLSVRSYCGLCGRDSLVCGGQQCQQPQDMRIIVAAEATPDQLAQLGAVAGVDPGPYAITAYHARISLTVVQDLREWSFIEEIIPMPTYGLAQGD